SHAPQASAASPAWHSSGLGSGIERPHNSRQPMDAPERYEQLIAYLESNLPAPVDRQETADGAVQFIAGEPAEVVVSLTETSVLVSEFSGVWESPFPFAARPRRG